MSKERKVFIKNLILVLLALSALVCAAINLHISLNMLGNADHKE